MNKYVIAQKLQSTTSSLTRGYIKPFVIEEGNERVMVESTDFPNSGNIFIPFDYNDIERFNEDDLFRIPFEENRSSGMDEDHPNNCRYKASGREAKSLNKYEYFHIVEKQFDPTNLTVNMGVKPVRCIFIHDRGEKCIYGPFESQDIDQESYPYKIRIKPLESRQYFNAPQYCILKISDDKFPIIPIRDNELLVTDLSTIQEQILEPDYVDCITDEQLIVWGNNEIERHDDPLKKDILKSFIPAIQKINEVEKFYSKNRIQRLYTLASKTEAWLAQRSIFINEFLKTDSGTTELNTFFQNNKEFYLDLALQKDETSQKYLSHLENLEMEIGERQQEKKQLDDELSRKKDEIKKRQEENIQGQISEIEGKLTELQNEHSLKENELNSLITRLHLVEKIDKLHIEHEVKEREKEKLDLKVADLIIEKQNLDQLNAQSRQQYQQKLIDVKSVLSVVNLHHDDEPTAGDTRLTSPMNKAVSPVTISDLVSEIHLKLKNNGRDLSYEMVANCLVTVHQNFLTIFAGLPGVGKTSLAIKLAQAIGLKSNSRFLDIKTARGWTSKRDILGFYNPLNQRYQEAATGLYRALRNCQRENQTSEEFPFWVLLDEANLSPIEHYWSDFLSLCDRDINRSINTGEAGEKADLPICNSVRFLGTVNYDSTTEPISPRMIDRVPVIYLEPSEQLIDFDQSEKNLTDDSIYSYQNLDSLLIAEKLELTNAEQRIFESLRKSLHSAIRGATITISIRKQQQIISYCATARSLMKEKYDLCALDYAIAQFILPLINGNGSSYRELLQKFQKEIEPLDHTKRLLNRIVEIGEQNHHFYSFFC